MGKFDTTSKATHWSVTINNPTASDEENIATARQKGWKVEGQLEKGDNGTPHYQLHVTSKGQVRGRAVKDQFPRAHIEIARSVKHLEQYVVKEDTRVGQLPTTQDLYPSLQKLWDMFAEWLDNKTTNWWDWGPEKALHEFDLFIGDKIEEGYVVETMAVNPQIRSAVKNYFVRIIYRSNIRRQKTDRQTADNNVEVNSITNATEVEETQSEEEQTCKDYDSTSESSS
nr:MAG: replication polyprotein [Chemarfal virus 231]